MMPQINDPLSLLALWALLGYLLGSIPFGMILTQLMGLGNLRKIGSGNIGATNVLRTGSKSAAALTLLLDGGKGALALLIARAFGGEDAAQIAGLMAMIGHCFPIWLGFAGGKGVATFLGLLLALNWVVGIACCLTWLIIAGLARISSLSALCAALAALPATWLLGQPDALILLLMLIVLIFWRHRENIARLRNGTEPKIGQKS